VSEATAAGGSLYLALELADSERLGAIAQEGSLDDAQLDALERALPELDPSEGAATAFTLARAGRRSTGPLLHALRHRLLGEGQTDVAQAMVVAMELLPLRPGPKLSRAEAGYRWLDPETGSEVFVEDPLAAHWHAAGRWGPPIRPWLDTAPLWFDDRVALEDAVSAARDGRVVVCTFSTPFGRSAPSALRLTRAGLARDAGFSSMIRWSEVRSLGWVESGDQRRVGFEAGALHELPRDPSGGAPRLMALMQTLADRGRPAAT
jgi:hypothetical protein